MRGKISKLTKQKNRRLDRRKKQSGRNSNDLVRLFTLYIPLYSLPQYRRRRRGDGEINASASFYFEFLKEKKY